MKWRISRIYRYGSRFDRPFPVGNSKFIILKRIEPIGTLVFRSTAWVYATPNTAKCPEFQMTNNHPIRPNHHLRGTWRSRRFYRPTRVLYAALEALEALRKPVHSLWPNQSLNSTTIAPQTLCESCDPTALIIHNAYNLFSLKTSIALRCIRTRLP